MMKRTCLSYVAKFPIALLIMSGALTAEVAAAPLQTKMLVKPAADTYIQSNMADINFGHRDALELGHTAGGERRVLIRFDLSTLEDNIQVESVELLLRVTQYPDQEIDSVPVTVHRILSAWKEGDGQGSTSAKGYEGATWLRPDRAEDSVQWVMPGAGGDGEDRATKPSDTTDLRDQKRLTLLPGIPARFFVLDVTEDVQRFLRGEAPNHGWLLSIPESTKARVRFNSKDAGEDARHPRLRITYRKVHSHD